MRRTNIYLTDEELRLLSERARLENTSMAELVRRILYKELGLVGDDLSRQEVIRRSAGAWSDRSEDELEELRMFRSRSRTFDAQ